MEIIQEDDELHRLNEEISRTLALERTVRDLLEMTSLVAQRVALQHHDVDVVAEAVTQSNTRVESGATNLHAMNEEERRCCTWRFYFYVIAGLSLLWLDQ